MVKIHYINNKKDQNNDRRCMEDKGKYLHIDGDAYVRLSKYYYNNELYWSSFVISTEGLRSIYLSDRFDSARLPLYKNLIKTLYKLNSYNRIKSILQTSYKSDKIISELLKDEEIMLICYKIGCDIIDNGTVRSDTIYDGSVPEDSGKSKIHISFKSKIFFHKALIQKESIRKSYFMKSFNESKVNTEGLIYMFMESSIMYRELEGLIMEIENREIQGIFINYFINNSDNLENSNDSISIDMSPLKLLVYLHTTDDIKSLYSIAVLECNRDFSDHYILHFISGLYILYKELKIESGIFHFMKSLSKNEHFGLGYLYLGISKSLLREIEDSRKMLKKAYQVMGSNPTVSYLLGFEYYISCNFKISTYYLELMLEQIQLSHANGGSIMKTGSSSDHCDYFINFYIYVLISNEEYSFINEILNNKLNRLNIYINKNNVRIDPLLVAYFYLFTSNYNESIRILASESTPGLIDQKEDHLFLTMRGYLCHLIDEFDNAIFYYKSAMDISTENKKIINELIFMAMGNKNKLVSHGTEGKVNRAYEFATALFDLLPYKEQKLYTFL